MPPARLNRDIVLAWLEALIEQTCTRPPVLVGKGRAERSQPSSLPATVTTSPVSSLWTARGLRRSVHDHAVDSFRTPRVRTATRRLARAFGSPIPLTVLERISTPAVLIWDATMSGYLWQLPRP